jgi:Txe/YoeB family toxin of Txe-Axe toxin-antitoxin module
MTSSVQYQWVNHHYDLKKGENAISFSKEPFILGKNEQLKVVVNNKGYFDRRILANTRQIFMTATEDNIVTFNKAKPGFANEARRWEGNTLATWGQDLSLEETSKAVDDFIAFALEKGLIEPLKAN